MRRRDRVGEGARGAHVARGRDVVPAVGGAHVVVMQDLGQDRLELLDHLVGDAEDDRHHEQAVPEHDVGRDGLVEAREVLEQYRSERSDKVIEIFQQAIGDAENLLTALPEVFDDIFNAQQTIQQAQQAYINNVLPTLRGDANGDGEINMLDAICVANAILGNPDASFDEKAADANLDGVIGMSDVMYIVNYVLNGKFPEEQGQ